LEGLLGAVVESLRERAIRAGGGRGRRRGESRGAEEVWVYLSHSFLKGQQPGLHWSFCLNGICQRDILSPRVQEPEDVVSVLPFAKLDSLDRMDM
jgi:hypothetical protein